ncbi:AT-hook motif nuclear-localized protein 14-like [Amaranthus tricolor]|uniref:AT-hook motif nuclear-localized protein 14-like n=1 Tax=Amaranthus tricolor TaxID=29722 RepID=UPI00258F4ACA|nr:AT-hook motif nuclear-localized protein 14-like [Amaranthus tricolor]
MDPNSDSHSQQQQQQTPSTPSPPLPFTATPAASPPPTNGTSDSSGTKPSTATPVANPPPTNGTYVCSYDGTYFKTRVVNVASGEDVYQKILALIQQKKRALCILWAQGFTSSASLQPPTTFGKNGCQILSLTGSFVRPHSGELMGGLSASLLDTDGQIVGGRLVGPLIAAGPVEVLVGTFFIKPNKDASAGVQKHASTSSIPKN